LDNGDRFQVKRLMVKPGGKLSLQLHRKRSEHWVVVSGTAKVTRGEEVFDLLPDQSTYLPIGIKHRLENVTNEPVYMIEVQSGDYLGEDDIERFDDIYKRD
jgi:mannose-1-phosphate guanylyltransferase/mannose-6-phosphate isomerase